MFGKKSLNRSGKTCYGWVEICHLAWGGGKDVNGHVASSSQCQVSSYQFQTMDCPEQGSGGNSGTPGLTDPPPPQPDNQSGTIGGGSNTDDYIIIMPTFNDGDNFDINNQCKANLFTSSSITSDMRNWLNHHNNVFFKNKIYQLIDSQDSCEQNQAKALELWNFLYANQNISTKIIDYVTKRGDQNFAWEFINSCIESGLNLDFEKSLKSPANIDFSAIDKTTPEGQKLDCIYQKLMQSPSFKNLFSDIFGNNDRVNVKFGIKNSSELVDNQGNPVLGQTNTVSIQNGVININVNINQQFLLNQSPFNFGSNVYIAKVIAHECLHAYLQYIRIHDVNFPNITIPNLNNQTIAQLITSYVDQYHGGYEHNFIANELLPHLANVLNEIKNLTLSSSDISNLGDSTIDLPNAGINNEAFNWDDFFKSLALQGLEKTNYFSNNYHTFNGNNPLSVIQYSNISNSGRYFFYNAKAKNTTTNCN
jgi:hypothetical protein